MSLPARSPGLRRKILVVAVVPTALLTAAFLAVFGVQRSRLEGQVEAELSRLAEEHLRRAARDLGTLCEATHRELSQQVPRSLRVARDQLARIGAPSLGRETVAWRAVNQLDGSASDVRLPRLLLGGRWAGQNADPGRPTLLVDRVRELVGAEATLFQRIGDRGDMIRVATTVRDAHGQRAIGTVIPAVDPDGRPNPVVSTVLRGETYQGRARVLDSWYLAAYEPLRDPEGRVCGMLFIGMRQDSLEGIRAGVAASRIGDTGEIWVVGGTGNQRGRWLIAPRGKVDGDDAWSERDAGGHLYVQEIVKAAQTAPPGETVRFVWTPPGAGDRARLAAVTYFAPWDWVIVAEMDRAETVVPFRHIQSFLATSVLIVVLAAALLLAGTFFAAQAAARRIARPLEDMAIAAERIARGDVRQDLTYRSGDEVGRLAEAFRGTIAYMEDVARAAEALARGELSTALVPRSERDELTQSFRAAQSELRRVIEELNGLDAAAMEGRLDLRADASTYSGDFRRIVEGGNATLARLVAHLDAMPVPAMIVGPDLDIRYMNQTGASLLGRSPRELVGTKCHDSFRMGDCGTERCACTRAMRQNGEVSSETDAHPEGLDLDVVYSAVPIHDAAGRVVGALEVIGEQTATRRDERRAVSGPGTRERPLRS